MNIYYNDDYTKSEFAFDTTRKSAQVAQRITEGRPSISLVSPEVDYDPRRVHDSDYVAAVLHGDPEDLAQSQGFIWDEGIYDMALAHSKGLVAATADALNNTTRTGSLSSGLHHARIDEGAGYCTFNGLAAAFRTAVDMGATNVLVLDFDAHYGGGTHNILGEDQRFTQVDVTVSAYDRYFQNDRDLVMLSDHDTYLDDIEFALFFANQRKYDFIIYNAGMDPYNASVTYSQLAKREEMVREYVGNTPAVFALAGGYTWGDVTMEEVVDLHMLTVDAWSK